MKDFMVQAKGMTKNPLGIIALFISLIYGFACLVLGFAVKTLQGGERILLICFLIGFPVLILGAFLYLVVKHHKKLYAPSDYKDEKNFFKDFENQQNIEEVKEFEISKITEIESIKDEAMLSLLKWGSGKGLFALYAIYLAEKNKVRFTLEDLESHSPFLTKDYVHGFLVAASSCGAFFWAENAKEPFLVGGIHPLISSKIRETVYAFATNESDDSRFLYQELKRIEEAFK